MGTSITSWKDAAAYFMFADNPVALGIFAVGIALVVAWLIGSIIKHEDQVFENYK